MRGDHIDPPSAAIYETLLVRGDDGAPLPGLADKWEVQDDGRTWRLRLRDGARFHSGRPCDAPAVVAALDLCRWVGGAPRQVWYWDPVDEVVAESDREIAFHLRHPCDRLPALLWGEHTAIVNPETWHAYGDDFGRVLADGTGPYRLATYSPDEVVVERAAADDALPATIRWRALADLEARIEVLHQRSADVVRAVPAIPEGLRGHWSLHTRPESSQFYLALNHTDDRGFGAASFRRAVEAFIDRAEIVEHALDGRGDSRRSPIPIADQFAAAFDADGHAAMTVADAHDQLAASGWSPGPDGVLERAGVPLRIDCVAQDTTECRRIARVVADQLAVAGIELRFSYEPLFEPFYRAVEANPAAFLSKWLWPDAMEAVYGFSRADCAEPAGGNWQLASCPSVDSAYDSFLAARGRDELTGAAREVQRVFMSELPYIPLVSPRETLARSPRARSLQLGGTLYPRYERLGEARTGARTSNGP